MIGSEKIETLHHWYRINDILKMCKFLVIRRSDLEKSLNENEFYNAYKDSFIFEKKINGIENISSSNIRKALINNDLKALKEETTSYTLKILINCKNK